MTTPKIDWRRSFWPPVEATREPGWQQILGRAGDVLPYILLAVPSAISLPRNPDWTTGGLVAAAAVWVLLTFTLPGARLAETPWFALLRFAGLVTLAGLLEARDTTFLVFMIIGFFDAIKLRPGVLAFAGVGVTSVLINSIPNGGPLTAIAHEPVIWPTVFVVQTLAIGGGAAMSAAMTRHNVSRQKALDELAAAQAENEGLQRQLLSQAREAGVLDERQRLAQEIHDTLAQGFTGIITQLEAAAQAKADPAEWQRHLDNATALARENLTAARRSVHALHPEPLDAATLPEALAEVAAQWSARTGVTAGFTTTGNPQRLHPEIEATLLRVTQEALSNVDKHAAAKRVGLTLSYMDDEVTLDVRDDGVGFEPGDTDGFGLPGMRRRVQRLAGTLHVESEPGGGTAISAILPAVPLLPEAS